jgi:hypothetical protein
VLRQIVEVVTGVVGGPLPWQSRLSGVLAARALCDRTLTLLLSSGDGPGSSVASSPSSLLLSAMQRGCVGLLSPVAVCAEELVQQQVCTGVHSDTNDCTQNPLANMGKWMRWHHDVSVVHLRHCTVRTLQVRSACMGCLEVLLRVASHDTAAATELGASVRERAVQALQSVATTDKAASITVPAAKLAEALQALCVL